MLADNERAKRLNHSLLEAVAASFGAFALAMVACASRGWHKPRDWAILVIFVGAMVAGAVLARWRFAAAAKPLDDHGRFSTRAIGPCIAAAAFVTAAFAAFAVVTALVLWLGTWNSLVGASVAGSLCMAMVPLAPLFVHRLFESRVDVGYDAIARGLPRRAIELREVADAKAELRVVTVRLRRGARFELHMVSDEIAALFANLIRDRAAPVEIPAGLGRAGRSLATWRADLGSSDYRKSTISADEAERVLRAGCATADQRIGAALALAALGEHERVARVRRAYVHSELTVALERAVDGTLDDDCIPSTERV